MPVALSRRADWQQRLIALANERRSLPYRYGENDCWCFARAAIEAMTGTILLPEVAAPRSGLAALRAMKMRGWDDVEEVMTGLLGPPIEPAESRRGDIVSFRQQGEFHLAVRVGGVALSPSQNGMMVVNPIGWRRAWKVG